jgi:hypothetical protein
MDERVLQSKLEDAPRGLNSRCSAPKVVELRSVARLIELRVIERVEEFRPELKAGVFPQSCDDRIVV